MAKDEKKAIDAAAEPATEKPTEKSAVDAVADATAELDLKADEGADDATLHSIAPEVPSKGKYKHIKGEFCLPTQ